MRSNRTLDDGRTLESTGTTAHRGGALTIRDGSTFRNLASYEANSDAGTGSPSMSTCLSTRCQPRGRTISVAMSSLSQ